jgi:hypothetical protein
MTKTKDKTIKIRVSIQLYDATRQQYVPTRNLRFVIDPSEGSPGLIAAVADALIETVGKAGEAWSEI